MAHKIVLSGVSEEMYEGIYKLADGKKKVANDLIIEVIRKCLIKAEKEPVTERIEPVVECGRVRRKFWLDDDK
jgi:hypothetical protein